MSVDRRTALWTLATGAVGAVSWVESLTAISRQEAHNHLARAAIAAQDWTPKVLTPAQDELVATLAELIIPATDTPGARAARVNRFVDRVLQEAQPADRARFLEGLAWLDGRSKAISKAGFAAAPPDQQNALLSRLSAESAAAEEARGAEFFRAMKSMTIDGYYTSEIGLRQELGDSGQLFLPKSPGCDHPEHQ
jgi:hypothetical protein